MQMLKQLALWLHRYTRRGGLLIKRGQYIYAGLTVLCLVLGTVLATTGQPTLALVPFIAGIGAGIGVVVKPVSSDKWRAEVS